MFNDLKNPLKIKSFISIFMKTKIKVNLLPSVKIDELSVIICNYVVLHPRTH